MRGRLLNQPGATRAEWKKSAPLVMSGAPSSTVSATLKAWARARGIGQHVRAAVAAVGELAAVADHAADGARELRALRPVHHDMRHRGFAGDPGAARLEVDRLGEAAEVARRHRPR